MSSERRPTTFYPPEGWQELKGQYEQLRERMTGSGRAFPYIPELIRPKLMQYDRDGIWGTAKDLDPYDIYQLFAFHDLSQPIRYFREDRDDFVMMGTAGRSAAFYGLIARVGPLFVAQSTSSFDAYGGHMSKKRERADVCNNAWNTTVSELHPFLHEQLRVAVVHSDPRGYAQIWTKVLDGTVAKNPITEFQEINWGIGSQDVPHKSLLSWNILEDGRRDGFELRLQNLADGSDAVLAIAAKHLLAVTHG